MFPWVVPEESVREISDNQKDWWTTLKTHLLLEFLLNDYCEGAIIIYNVYMLCEYRCITATQKWVTGQERGIY